MTKNLSQKDGPKTLKSLSDTRWNCRIEAIRATDANFSALLSALHEISENDLVSGPNANSLIKSIETFDFVFCMHLLKLILIETNIWSSYLQSPTINYSSVMSMTKQTIVTLQAYRCDEKFNDIWTATKIIVDEHNLEEAQIPRKRKVPYKLNGGLMQQNFSCQKDYYRVNIYFAVLDLIIKEI